VTSLHPEMPTSVALRKFPYPFRAGLAICNDADLMTEESFRFVHRFLNTTKDTPIGPGLGLPISDSFFLFSSPDNPNRFTFLEDLSDKPSPRSGLLRDCAAAGLIDTLHTYGAFSSPSHFSRDLARRGIEALERAGMRIRVWVNHGPPENVQCFGPLAAPHFHGDDPESKFHHTDLTIDYGIQYCWTGEELGEAIAYDAQSTLASLWDQGALLLLALRKSRSLPRRPRLLTPISLRDTRRVLRFERYWGTTGQTPTVEDITSQLSARRLARLKRSAGYSIVYQHFAVRRKAPGFGVNRYAANVAPYFGPGEREAFIRLAREYHCGNVWVAFTERLLRYNRMYRWLRWSAEDTGNRIRIDLHGLEVPGMGRSEMNLGDIGDLTFYSSRPEETEVYLRNGPVMTLVRDIVRNPKDHTGRESLTLLGSSPGTPDL
jgi:hypothetical protein